jgi:hypothetical protein
MQDAFGVSKAFDPTKVTRYLPKKQSALSLRLRAHRNTLEQARNVRRLPKVK